MRARVLSVSAPARQVRLAVRAAPAHLVLCNSAPRWDGVKILTIFLNIPFDVNLGLVTSYRFWIFSLHIDNLFCLRFVVIMYFIDHLIT